MASRVAQCHDVAVKDEFFENAESVIDDKQTAHTHGKIAKVSGCFRQSFVSSAAAAMKSANSFAFRPFISTWSETDPKNREHTVSSSHFHFPSFAVGDIWLAKFSQAGRDAISKSTARNKPQPWGDRLR
jgi:hypothetical protein